ncbi:hypothetical protein [Pseudoalteromonas prydzensis]|uniref:hypothetical protein n=1 Tax=Pseudoalteromonas prydzensis TaxID=182141 RepID=UPI0007E4EBC1|nr:hypothetical protein [Pseudoalteromonas prydzensis]MBE0378186.1 hypothetical protein [Pseudoalteromonas prydzensis ACAM 620]
MAQFTLINGDVIEFSNNIVTPLNCVGSQSCDRLGHIFFIPDTVVPFINAGKLAKDLFNVSKLALAKYDDTKTVLPVLIKHQQPLNLITGITIKRQFKIINFSSANIEKSQAASVFKKLLTDPAVEHVKLDEVKQLC